MPFAAVRPVARRGNFSQVHDFGGSPVARFMWLDLGNCWGQEGVARLRT